MIHQSSCNICLQRMSSMVFDRQISTKMQKFLIKTTLNSNVNIQFGVDILFIWPVARLTNNNNNQFYLYVNTA